MRGEARVMFGGRGADDWDTVSIKTGLHHLAIVRQMYSTDSCQLVYTCKQVTVQRQMPLIAPPCTGSLSITKVTFLFSCSALLIIMVKRLQLQCSFPLFSLCGKQASVTEQK